MANMSKNKAIDDGRKKMLRAVDRLESRFDKINKKRLNEIRDFISSSSNLSYTKEVQSKIDEKLRQMLREAELEAIEFEKNKIIEFSASASFGTAKIVGDAVSKKSIIKVMERSVKPKLSSELHSTNVGVLKQIRAQLKKSINAGDSVYKLSKKLTELDPTKVKIPKYIADIRRAVLNTAKDPADRDNINRAIARHQKYIDNLTRAGEEGFQHLGLRGAGQAFLKDVQKATAETIDNVVTRWAQKKALNQQKVVARTETNNAYHRYNFEYAFESEHIIGIEVYLSGSHPDYEPGVDPCEPKAGVYLFEEWGRDIDLPSFHPNCLCGFRFVFSIGEIKGSTVFRKSA